MLADDLRFAWSLCALTIGSLYVFRTRLQAKFRVQDIKFRTQRNLLIVTDPGDDADDAAAIQFLSQSCTGCTLHCVLTTGQTTQRLRVLEHIFSDNFASGVWRAIAGTNEIELHHGGRIVVWLGRSTARKLNATAPPGHRAMLAATAAEPTLSGIRFHGVLLIAPPAGLRISTAQVASGAPVIIVGDDSGGSVNTGNGLAGRDAAECASNMTVLRNAGAVFVGTARLKHFPFVPRGVLGNSGANTFHGTGSGAGADMVYPRRLQQLVFDTTRNFLCGPRPAELTPSLQARAARTNRDQLWQLFSAVCGATAKPVPDAQSLSHARRYMAMFGTEIRHGDGARACKAVDEDADGVWATAEIVQMTFELLGTRLVDGFDGVPLQRYERPVQASAFVKRVGSHPDAPLMPAYDLVGAILLVRPDLVPGVICGDENACDEVRKLGRLGRKRCA
eukprot:g2818.t1